MTSTFEMFIEESMPGLLRFGQVLTGDSDEARRLVRAAVTGTSWRRARRAADPAAQIRHAMAREYARWPSSAAGESRRTDPVGEALASLSPRQRAVTILRYGEGLSDVAAARALGVKIPTAKNEATSALSRMRATFPETTRPDAAELGQRVREFLTAIDTDVSRGDLTTEHLTRAAGRARLQRAALAVGGALVAGALIVGTVLLLATGDDSDRGAVGSSAESSPDPSPTTLGGLGEVSVEGLTELTPDAFEGLAIGMTVAEVESAFGADAQFREQVPGTGCELQVDIGPELTGWFDRWPLSEDGEPGPDAELVLTEVAYYGDEAKTAAGVVVGMMIEDADQAASGVVVSTPVGDVVHTVYIPPNPSSSWGVVGGIGYRVWPPPRCGPGIILGAEEPSTSG